MNTVIIAEYRDDEIAYQLYFDLRHKFDTHDEAVQAIRDAVREWGRTEGKHTKYVATWDFNWGDVALYLHDIFPFTKGIASITVRNPEDAVRVNHDERLFKEVT